MKLKVGGVLREVADVRPDRSFKLVGGLYYKTIAERERELNHVEPAYGILFSEAKAFEKWKRKRLLA